MISKTKDRFFLIAALVVLLSMVAFPVWAHQATYGTRLIGLSGEAFDSFGYSVAVDGDTAAVGAPYHDDPDTDTGAVDIYVRSGTTWTWMKKLVPTRQSFLDSLAFYYFGHSVALSGNTLAVGAPGNNDDTITNHGAVYVYVGSGSSWTLQAKLYPGSGDRNLLGGDNFGHSVALEGDTLAIGAPDDDEGLGTGAVYIYTRSGSSWTLQAKLYPGSGYRNLLGGDNFGYSVALSGNKLLVGARYDDEKGISSGSAYVYVGSGPNWYLQAKLTASDGELGDNFGHSVALSGDTALIGAPYEDEAGPGAGSVYIYGRSGPTWSQVKKIVAPGDLLRLQIPAADNFGWSVDLDDNTAIIGAKDFTDYSIGLDFLVGATYLYVRNLCTGDWQVSDQIIAVPASERTIGDNFGYSVAVDGNAAVVGAKDFDVGGILGINEGAAFAFTLTWKDTDGDGLADVYDNCPSTFETSPVACAQADSDGDGVGDICDNCPDVYNPPEYLGLQLPSQPDTDGDGFGNECDCPTNFFGPLDADIHPGAPEICDNKDNDCDGTTDGTAGVLLTRPTNTTCGVGACAGNTGTETCLTGNWIVTKICNPLQGATLEICDGIDNNCDGTVDNGLTPPLADKQSGVCAGSLKVCSGTAGWAEPDYTAIPGYEANEVTCDGVDNDCDGQVDEGVLKTFFRDADADRCGDPLNTTLACTPPPGYVNNSLDCDDNNANAYPGNTEACDGVDNNCDGRVDEGFPRSQFFRDADADGWGSLVSIPACAAPPGYVKNSLDCDDNNPNIHPLAPETLCNGVDENCNGLADDDRNLDGDPVSFCNGDCDDNNPNRYPGNIEVCDGIDNNCNGEVDDDASGAPLSQACYSGPDGTLGVGLCKGGTQNCSNGTWAVCVGEVVPVQEVCDRMDNDCDGSTDENGVCQPPVASDQSVTTNEDTLLNIALIAADPEGDPLTYSVISGPSHGTLSGSPPILVYLPNANYNGPDSFTFVANDGLLDSNIATVSIAVTPVNDPPILGQIGNKEIPEGQLIQILLSATDPDGDTLFYTTGDLPAGSTFDASTQTFSWTPDYAQAGSYRVLFTVTDNGTPLASDSETITITVGNVNRPPIINPIGNKVASEGEPVVFTVTAADPDGNDLTYSAGNLPGGAVFDSSSQTFTWTPGYDQAGNYVDVRFTVTDNGSPPLPAQEAITITVGNVNRPPVLNPVGNKNVTEGEPLTIALTATDPDGDALTYSADNLPDGATFDPGTQEFRWTPGYDQSGNYEIELSVEDSGSPIEVDSEVIMITVGNVNRAPVFTSVGTQQVPENQLLQFYVSATDDDGDAIAYSTGPLPSGASFDPENQLFSWRPDSTQAGGYTVAFYATDSGSPSMTGQIDVVINVGDVPTPCQLTDQIIQAVLSLNLPEPVENSYMTHLKKVCPFVEDGKILRAIVQLDAFIIKVIIDMLKDNISDEAGRNLIHMAIDLMKQLRG
jgi:hypothetical protein